MNAVIVTPAGLREGVLARNDGIDVTSNWGAMASLGYEYAVLADYHGNPNLIRH